MAQTRTPGRPKRSRAVAALLLTWAMTPAAGSACVGDCDGSGAVSIDELTVAIRVALGLGASADCVAVDGNASGTVEIDELVASVANALRGCPATATASQTPTATPRITGTMLPTPTAVLIARLSTDRGCIETGEDPSFAIGEDANLKFRIDGAVGFMAITEAQVVITISVDGVPLRGVDLGLQTTAVLHGTELRITGPVGTETLVLTAQGGPGPLVAQSQCSFLVESVSGESG
jgi:hypothetical protein